MLEKLHKVSPEIPSNSCLKIPTKVPRRFIKNHAYKPHKTFPSVLKFMLFVAFPFSSPPPHHTNQEPIFPNKTTQNSSEIGPNVFSKVAFFFKIPKMFLQTMLEKSHKSATEIH